MAIIDADAHVLETERTWEYASDAERQYMPRVLVPRDSQPGGAEFWLVDGRAFAKNANVGKDTPDGAREMSDIARRIAHMDELGVDVHVLYPSIFLRPLTRRPEVEVALARSYNRWLGDIWRMGQGRLRWAIVIPAMSMNEAIEEVRWGKEHGACAIYMRGVEGYLRLSDPYFFPLYEEASKLDLPICIHASQGSFDGFDLYSRDAGFAQFKLTVVGAFHDLLMKETPARFPDLRWGFIEVSSQWVPYALNDMELRFKRLGRRWLGPDTMRENRIYVACQTTDDLPYVLQHTGDENVVIGTDYGHNDTSSEILALQKLKDDGKVGPAVAEKILDRNARTLYAL